MSDGDFDQEAVQQGEKYAARLRKDKRIKRYLLAKRPQENDDRILNYRTECCVGYHKARKDGAAVEILNFIKAEHDWAAAICIHRFPAGMADMGYEVPVALIQMDLFVEEKK